MYIFFVVANKSKCSMGKAIRSHEERICIQNQLAEKREEGITQRPGRSTCWGESRWVLQAVFHSLH
jgi:hypothetical protein